MDPIATQAYNSRLSKQGKKTTTGVFEGKPQNAVVNERQYTKPGAVEKMETPYDIAFKNKIFAANTYLEYLENVKKK